MVTTAQGLELFQSGMKGLGEGLGTYGKEKRLAKGAESIRGEDPSEFKGGEAGREQSALYTREGDLSAAAAMRAEKDDRSMNARLGDTTEQLGRLLGDPNADPEKVKSLRTLYNFQMATQRNLARFVMKTGQASDDGSGAFVPLGKTEEVKVPITAILKGIDDPGGPDRDLLSPGTWFESDEEAGARKKDYEDNFRQQVRKNLINSPYGDAIGEASIDFAVDQLWDMFQVSGAGSVENFMLQEKNFSIPVPQYRLDRKGWRGVSFPEGKVKPKKEGAAPAEKSVDAPTASTAKKTPPAGAVSKAQDESTGEWFYLDKNGNELGKVE